MKRLKELGLFLTMAGLSAFSGNASSLPASEQEVATEPEAVYVVGSFNDWKLPDGGNLNGAVRLTKDRETNQGHTYNTATPVVFPEGEVQFKVYVKGKDGKDSFYISRNKADQQQYQTLYKLPDTIDKLGNTVTYSDPYASYSGYAYDNKDANESTPLVLKDWNGKTLSIEVYPLTEWAQGKAYQVSLTSDEAPELPEELNIPDTLNTIVKEPGKEPQLFHGRYLTLRDINPSGEELEILYTIEDSTKPSPENCFGLIEPATIQIESSTINTDDADYPSRFWTNEGAMNFRRGSTIPIKISLCEGIEFVRISQSCYKNNEYIHTKVFAYPLKVASVPEVFVVGSFNDWKLPDGNNLNGAIRLERILSTWAAYVTDEPAAFPAGETQFKIYVRDNENKESFYISRDATTNQAFQTLFHLKDSSREAEAMFEGYTYADEEGTPFVLKDWNGKKISFSVSPMGKHSITTPGISFWVTLTSDDAPEIERFPVYQIVRVAGKDPEISGSTVIDMDINPEEETELEILYSTEESINPAPENCLGLIEPVTLTLDCPTNDPPERTEVRGGMNFQRGSTTPIKVKIAKGIDRIWVSCRPQLDMSFILTVVDGYSKTAGVDQIEESGNGAGYSVNGLTVTADECTALEVYSLTGIRLGAGNEVTVPSPGIYIIRTADKAVKIKL